MVRTWTLVTWHRFTAMITSPPRTRGYLLRRSKWDEMAGYWNMSGSASARYGLRQNSQTAVASNANQLTKMQVSVQPAASEDAEETSGLNSQSSNMKKRTAENWSPSVNGNRPEATNRPNRMAKKLMKNNLNDTRGYPRFYMNNAPWASQPTISQQPVSSK